MKKILFILLICPFFCFSQLKPYGHIEFQNYQIRVHNKYNSIIYSFPPVSTKLGISYTLKKFQISADSEVFSYYYKKLTFNPQLVIYDVKLSYKINKNIKIQYTHRCIHGVTTNTYKVNSGLYGGFNKIGIYLDLD